MGKISVARALVELKTLEKRIEKRTHQLVPVAVVVGDKMPAGTEDRAAFDKQAKADLQQVFDLIERKRVVKGAIVKSNAVTKVRIADETLTVAEAIERKISIALDKELLKVLREHLGNATKRIEKNNEEVQRRLDQLLEAALSKESKAKPEEHDAIAKPYLAKNEARLADPLKIEKAIRELDEKITTFEEQVDVALTESNARTDIDV